MQQIQTAHYKGAANEMVGASYYLKRGCQVYLPVCQQGQVDLVVESPGGPLKRVQVKTATWNRSHPQRDFEYLQCRVLTTNRHKAEDYSSLFDVLLVVNEDEIWEIPSSEVHSSNISLRTAKGRPTKWDKYKVTN